MFVCVTCLWDHAPSHGYMNNEIKPSNVNELKVYKQYSTMGANNVQSLRVMAWTYSYVELIMWCKVCKFNP